MRKIQLITCEKFSDAVQAVLDSVNGDYGNYVYSVVPQGLTDTSSGNIDCMIVGDGVAFDFGEVVYCEKGNNYTAYEYRMSV